LRKILADLCLEELTQFYVVLGTAEKLQPGVYSQALGDTLTMEDRLTEMIDSF